MQQSPSRGGAPPRDATSPAIRASNRSRPKSVSSTRPPSPRDCSTTPTTRLPCSLILPGPPTNGCAIWRGGLPAVCSWISPAVDRRRDAASAGSSSSRTGPMVAISISTPVSMRLPRRLPAALHSMPNGYGSDRGPRPTRRCACWSTGVARWEAGRWRQRRSLPRPSPCATRAATACWLLAKTSSR